jgi:hypothetical protein
MTVADRYLIWSNEHVAWWGPGGVGYVESLAAAGRYDRTEALAICARAIPGTAREFGVLPELPVREADLQVLHTGYRSLLRDDAPPEPWE